MHSSDYPQMSRRWRWTVCLCLSLFFLHLYISCDEYLLRWVFDVKTAACRRLHGFTPSCGVQLTHVRERTAQRFDSRAVVNRVGFSNERYRNMTRLRAGPEHALPFSTATTTSSLRRLYRSSLLLYVHSPPTPGYPHDIEEVHDSLEESLHGFAEAPCLVRRCLHLVLLCVFFCVPLVVVSVLVVKGRNGRRKRRPV